MAIRQIIGGKFQDCSGSPLAAGYITFRLNTDASTAVSSGIQISAGILTKATLDSNGSISGTIYLWPNDQLFPTNTVYIIRAYTNSGELGWKSENVIPSGVGLFDLGQLVPLY
jgi:hypothetical protein